MAGRGWTLEKIRARPYGPGREMPDEIVEFCLKLPPSLQSGTLYCLDNSSIRTMEALLAALPHELLSIPNFGLKKLHALQRLMGTREDGRQKEVLMLEKRIERDKKRLRQLRKEIATA